MWPNMQCNAVDPAVEYETMWLLVDSTNYGNYFHELCGIRKLPHFGNRSHIDVCLYFRNDFYALYLFDFSTYIIALEFHDTKQGLWNTFY